MAVRDGRRDKRWGVKRPRMSRAGPTIGDHSASHQGRLEPGAAIDEYRDQLRQLCNSLPYPHGGTYLQRNQSTLRNRALGNLGLRSAHLLLRAVPPPNPFPVTMEEYVGNARHWLTACADGQYGALTPIEQGIVKRDLHLDPTYGPPDGVLEASCLVVEGKLANGLAHLMEHNPTAAGGPPLSGMSADGLVLLYDLAAATGNVEVLVTANRARFVNEPSRAREADEREADRAQQWKMPELAEAIRARSAQGGETVADRDRRLGLDRVPANLYQTALWDACRDERDLTGPLAACAIVLRAITREVSPEEGSGGLMLSADLLGGGHLRAPIDPDVAAAFAPVLQGGTCVEVTLSLYPDPQTGATLATVAAVSTPGTAPPALAGRGAALQPFAPHDVTAQDLGWSLEMWGIEDERRVPAVDPPAVQAKRWNSIHPDSARRAMHRLALDHPAAYVPAPVSGAFHHHHFNTFTGQLPPHDGWRELAYGLWSPRVALYKRAGLAAVSARVLEDIGGVDQEVLLTASHQDLDVVTWVTDEFRAGTVDNRMRYWAPGRLVTALRDGMRLVGLKEWFSAGCCDPHVAAAFRDAGWTPTRAQSHAGDHLTALVVDDVFGGMQPGHRWITPELAAMLPGLATRGLTLDEAVMAFLNGDRPF